MITITDNFYVVMLSEWELWKVMDDNSITTITLSGCHCTCW